MQLLDPPPAVTSRIAPKRQPHVERKMAAAIVRTPAQHPAHKHEVRVEFLVNVPRRNGRDLNRDRIFIAGNHPRLGQWRADGLQLTPIGDCEYHGEVDLPRGLPIEYKITRGSWHTVEQSSLGRPIDNRRLMPDAGRLELITVEQWADANSVPTNATAELPARGTLQHHGELKSIHLDSGHRAVTMYLPPEYDRSIDRRYPVLYLQDGQNLFDPAMAFGGVHWGVAETADRLIDARRIEPLIIVGVHNSPNRLNEYAPVYDAKHNAGGGADLYVKFLVDELKPFIDSRYRTKREREHTGIGGSSLGAIVSFHACKQAMEAFGLCAALSPTLWWGGHRMIEHFTRDARWMHSLRMWIDMGTAEGCEPGEPSNHALLSARRFVDHVQAACPHHGCHVRYEEIEGAIHHELAWAARFDRVLKFLFGTNATAPAL